MIAGALLGPDFNPIAPLVLIAVGIGVYPTFHIMRRLDPAWLISIGLAGTVLLWHDVGIPISLARFVLLLGVYGFIVRWPGAAGRPRIAFRPVNLVLLAAGGYAVLSAIAAGVLLQNEHFFPLFDTFGLLAFGLFILAPSAFVTERQRNIFLGVMVGVGAYLGLTALFETLNLDALIWPRYILDPNVGIHFGRARGPFVEAGANGMALFQCAALSALAYTRWSGRWRRFAFAVAALCGLGVLFTLTRAPWIGGGASLLLTMLVFRELRQWLLPVALSATVALAGATVLVPGLEHKVFHRAGDQSPVWVRKNLNSAALRMAEAKPLFGVGFDNFKAKAVDYVRQADTYPLNGVGEGVHNVFLANLSQLGFLGTSLWAIGLLLALGGAIVLRGPPELRPWRMVTFALAIDWLVLSNLGPTQFSFSTLTLWTVAGIARGPVAPPSPAEIPEAAEGEPAFRARALATGDDELSPLSVLTAWPRLQIAFLTTVLSEPPASGGEIVSHAFIDALRASGHRVRPIGYARPGAKLRDPDAEVVGFRSIETAAASWRERAAWTRSALESKLPYSAAKYLSRSYREAAQRAARDPDCDLVVVDHAQLGWLAGELAGMDKPVVFIAHNVEERLYAEREGLPGPVRRRESQLIAAQELKLARLAEEVWALTPDIAKHFERLSKSRVRTFDVPVTATNGRVPASWKVDVGLIGTWTWAPNREGLRWFLDRVLPLLPPGVGVDIAGQGARQLLAGRSTARALGYVDDAAEFALGARVLAVPAVAGDGVQVSMLHAIGSRTWVVATPHALRGITTPPPTVRVAKGAEAFAHELLSAIASPPGDERLGAVSNWCVRRRFAFEWSVGESIAALAS